MFTQIAGKSTMFGKKISTEKKINTVAIVTSEITGGEASSARGGK